MRVLKQMDQSFLAGVLGLQGKLFFAASCLLFFDLEHPETPLPEKELWQLVKKRIPKMPPFDAGMPKPQAEVLVHGACHPPRGDALGLEAAEVSLRLGELDKRLYVFGPRHWEFSKTGWNIVHDEPVPGPLPLTWKNAFGGDGFPDNPLGKGMPPQTDETDGAEASAPRPHPLPQVEDPGHLIGAREDRPQPAALAPLEQMWPQRMKHAGTYDEAWLKEHWPHFPPDFDLRFFNTAPPDQRIEGYFHGEEALRLQCLHPLRPVIESRLPGLKIRCFATLLDDPLGDRKDLSAAHFQELDTRLDTVWLFPEEMRGVCCFRGLCEIKDDEYRDVANILLVTEPLDAPSQPLEHYRDLRDTWVERALQLDKTHLQDGKQAIADALNRLKTMPAEIQANLDKGLGKTPRASTTPGQQFAAAHKRLDAASALLDKMESKALAMRAKHGHLTRIDLGHFSAMREAIATQRATIQGMEKTVAQALDETQQQRQQAFEQALKRKKDLEARGIKADFDPDDLLLPPKEKRWQQNVLQHLGPWREELLANAPLHHKLLDLGLSERTIANALLGYNPAPLEVGRKAWGLDPAEGTFTIPAGLVLPQFEDATPVALRIRPLEQNTLSLQEEDVLPDHLVEGSLPPEQAPFLAAAAPGRLLARVADPLEALLLAQEAGDLCAAIVLDSPESPLSPAGEPLLKEAPAFVLALRGKRPEDVEKQWYAWRAAKPEALRLPLHHGGLFQAKAEGRNIRAMLRQALPPQVAETLPPEPDAPLTANDIKPGMSLPLPDIKKLVSESRAKAKAVIEARIAPVKQEAEQARAKAMEQAATLLRKRKLDPEQYLKPSAKHTSLDFAKEKQEMLKALSTAKEKLAANKKLTPEIEQKLDGMGAKTGALMDKAAAVLPLEGGMRPPQWAKELRAKHGLDPETGEGLTRDKVAAMLQAGDKNFSRRSLAGLDLNGLDFSHANLERAVCLGTRFTNCNLRNANLRKALCAEADFGKASLAKADLARCVLNKALLKDADLSDSSCKGALLAETDCSGADFQKADLERAVLLKTKLAGASLRGVTARRAVFNQALLGGNDLAKADFSRAVFMKCPLDGLDFSGLTLHKTVFMGSGGQEVVFSRADMENARFLKGCSLPGAKFIKTRMHKLSAMDSAFPGADFSRASLDKALLQSCDLSQAILWHARARGARFPMCNLEKANLRGLDLLFGSLRKARLVEADCTGASFFGVDFYKAVMGDTVLDHADVTRSLLEKRTDLLP